jgi:hypothetical protein
VRRPYLRRSAGGLRAEQFDRLGLTIRVPSSSPPPASIAYTRAMPRAFAVPFAAGISALRVFPRLRNSRLPNEESCIAKLAWASAVCGSLLVF